MLVKSAADLPVQPTPVYTVAAGLVAASYRRRMTPDTSSFGYHALTAASPAALPAERDPDDPTETDP